MASSFAVIDSYGQKRVSVFETSRLICSKEIKLSREKLVDPGGFRSRQTQMSPEPDPDVPGGSRSIQVDQGTSSRTHLLLTALHFVHFFTETVEQSDL